MCTYQAHVRPIHPNNVYRIGQISGSPSRSGNTDGASNKPGFKQEPASASPLYYCSSTQWDHALLEGTKPGSPTYVSALCAVSWASVPEFNCILVLGPSEQLLYHWTWTPNHPSCIAPLSIAGSLKKRNCYRWCIQTETLGDWSNTTEGVWSAQRIYLAMWLTQIRSSVSPESARRKPWALLGVAQNKQIKKENK